MSFTAQEIVEAFLEQAADLSDLEDDGSNESRHRDRHVTFGRRGPVGAQAGYLRVWGPNARPAAPDPRGCYVIIERYNGVVSVRKQLAAFLTGSALRVPTQSILKHPLGYSCGPNFGLSTHGIPPAELGPGGTYPTPAKLVEAVVAAFESAGVAW